MQPRKQDTEMMAKHQFSNEQSQVMIHIWVLGHHPRGRAMHGQPRSFLGSDSWEQVHDSVGVESSAGLESPDDTDLLISDILLKELLFKELLTGITAEEDDVT